MTQRSKFAKRLWRGLNTLKFLAEYSYQHKAVYGTITPSLQNILWTLLRYNWNRAVISKKYWTEPEMRRFRNTDDKEPSTSAFTAPVDAICRLCLGPRTQISISNLPHLLTAQDLCCRPSDWKPAQMQAHRQFYSLMSLKRISSELRFSNTIPNCNSSLNRKKEIKRKPGET